MPRTPAITTTTSRRELCTSSKERSARTTSIATPPAGSTCGRASAGRASASTSTVRRFTACATPAAGRPPPSTSTRPPSGGWATTSPGRAGSGACPSPTPTSSRETIRRRPPTPAVRNRRAQPTDRLRATMTVVLTGSTLGLEQVLAVARGGASVELDPAALERMARARAVADRYLAAGETVYGLSTGVGVRKRARIEVREQAAFNNRLILNHLVGQGDAAPEDAVRATLLVLANGFARGATLAGPALAERVVAALNERRHPR